MKKTVLKLDLHDDKDKRKALKAVSTLSGIDSIAIDMKEGKMTVIGAADPIVIAKKLQKSWKVEIFSVGAPTKEGGGGGGGGGEKKNNPNVDQISELLKFYQAYPSQYYYAPRIEENPSNTCVIS